MELIRPSVEKNTNHFYPDTPASYVCNRPSFCPLSSSDVSLTLVKPLFMSTYKPAGFSALTTYLSVKESEQFVIFLKAAFNADREQVYKDDEGRVMHAHIYIDDAILEFAEARPEYPSMPTSFHLYVPDVDAIHEQAIAAGATATAEPVDQPYGERSSAVRDAWGNNWYIATYTGKMQEM